MIVQEEVSAARLQALHIKGACLSTADINDDHSLLITNREDVESLKEMSRMMSQDIGVLKTNLRQMEVTAEDGANTHGSIAGEE